MGNTWVRKSFSALILALIASSCCHADIEINARRDTVVLEDGTEITCYILMMSPVGIVIVETDPKNPEKKTQRTIGRSAIKNIVIGERSSRTEELLTDNEFARKVVLGSGTRKDDAADKTDDKKGDGKKGVASLKKSKHKKKDENEPEAAAAAKGGVEEKAHAKVDGAPEGATPPLPGTTVAGAAVVVPDVIPTKDVLDVYLSRYPDLQTPALDIVGAARIQEWVDASRSGNQGTKQPFDAQLNAYLGNVAEGPKSTDVQIKMAPPPRLGRYAQPEPPK